VRNRSRTVSVVFRVFLLGLAIPIQAVIVPTFYLLTKANLYDTLIAVILPTAAFSIPLSTIILTGAMRDITGDLFEAMALDGASPLRTYRDLVIPLSRGGLATILVFSALNAWNGFLFPLILTQSTGDRVFTLGLFDFSSTSGVDAPAVCAAVVLSIIPILLVYLFARRWLIRGLMGVGGK
jgi:xylobiose transport system permease protein